MRRIALAELVPDQVLSRPIYAASGALLLPAGKLVTERFVRSLEAWGLSEVYVEDLAAPETVPQPVRKDYDKAMSTVGDVFTELRRGNLRYITQVSDELGELALQMSAEPCIIVYLNLLYSRDEYTFHHSVAVGVVSALIGKWTGLPPEDLFNLASAGCMHDVGKAFVPLEILNKPGRLTPPEFEVVKAHSSRGHEVLAQVTAADSVMARVALEHHERVNGQGYPNGLRSSDTCLPARIVAVADVFHAMTSNRAYRGRQPGLAVLAQLRADGFSSLDPEVVQTFLQRMVPLSAGQRIRLSDGRIGRVVLASEATPERPIVEVNSALIDLAQDRSLSIVEDVED